MIVQPCSLCGCETKNKRMCPMCGHEVRFQLRLPKVKPPLERVVKSEIRKALVDAGCMVMIHNVDNRQMSTGLGKGVADIICIVPPHGRFLAVEVKREKRGVVSIDQLGWMGAVRSFGGVAGVATNVAEALALLALARQDASSAP